jgi:4-hydroxybutyrate dehydrogenase
VLDFNRDAATVEKDHKFDRLAHAMGLPDGDAIGPAIKALNQRLGLPSTLTEMGVTRDLFPKIVEGALLDHSHKTNPREASADDYARLLDRSM